MKMPPNTARAAMSMAIGQMLGDPWTSWFVESLDEPFREGWAEPFCGDVPFEVWFGKTAV